MDPRDEAEHEADRRRLASAVFWLKAAREAGTWVERDPGAAQYYFNYSFPVGMDPKLERELDAKLKEFRAEILRLL